MLIKLPYGKGEKIVNLPDERIEGVLTSRVEDYQPLGSQLELVRKALREPVGSRTLKKLAVGKDRIVIISSDHTRPVPSHLTMPLLLEEIRAGNPQADIIILVATGFHRRSTIEELRDKYGNEIVEDERIVVHDCRDQSMMVNLGTLPSGGELLVNRLAVEADLLIAEGFIEPHFFAGFSGGRKSILPGIASKETVLANHCAEFIDHQKARTGILDGNPLHRDMLYATEKAGLDFILNVILNGKKEIIEAVAGNSKKAHLKGCKFLDNLAGVEGKQSEIVITTNGGYPLDQNIYQAVKGMTAAEAVCKENGVIIMLAECSDGHGGEGFYNTFARAETVEAVMNSILSRDRHETIPDQWESQVLARILMHHTVIMISDLAEGLISDMYMKKAANLEQAIAMAEDIVGNKQSRITIIPDGVAVIIR